VWNVFRKKVALEQRCPTKMFLVATFATFVATKSLLSPQNGEIYNLVNILTMKPFLENLSVATFKWPVATCGEWRQGWPTLL